jgi:hypothetical protein
LKLGASAALLIVTLPAGAASTPRPSTPAEEPKTAAADAGEEGPEDDASYAEAAPSRDIFDVIRD